MKHTIGLAALLSLLWLGLSGRLDPLLLTLGLISTILTLYIAHRMDVVDNEHYPTHMNILLLRFWLFLFREIVRANFAVFRCILKPGKSISPQLIVLPLKQKTGLARVIYANAITLTPGTVCVRLDENSITVHTLTKAAAEDLASGRMADEVPENYESSET